MSMQRNVCRLHAHLKFHDNNLITRDIVEIYKFIDRVMFASYAQIIFPTIHY